MTAAKIRKNEKTKQVLEINVSRFLKPARKARLFENIIHHDSDNKK